MVIAASKPTVFDEEIISHFNLKQYFDVAVRSNLDGTRSAKNEVIQEVLKQFLLPLKESVVMLVTENMMFWAPKKSGVIV